MNDISLDDFKDLLLDLYLAQRELAVLREQLNDTQHSHDHPEGHTHEEE